MVKRLCVKRGFWLAITFFVIANLSLGSRVFAKQLTISAADMDKIKTVLDMTKTMTTVADMVLDNKDLLTILNTVIGGGKIATDITYGLVVLSTLSEMDLIDLVISQQYKIDARNYFNQVLDERTKLRSYWKGIGYDLPKVMSGYITGSMAALTLNSFEITDKTIAIFVEFNVLEKMKLYDGLWYYFDTRKQGNEPHNVAWSETKEVLGWVAKSTSFYGFKQKQRQEDSQLEQQFLTLYETWAPYVTPFGISEKYKKQVKEELSGALIAAAKENAALAKNESKISLIDKLTQQLEKLKAAAAALMAKANPFKAGVALNLPEEPEIIDSPAPAEELLEVPPPTTPPTTEEEPLERIEVIELGIKQLAATTTIPEIIASTTEPVLPREPALKPAPTPGPVF